MNDAETPHSIERPRKVTVRPEDGVMWVAVGPDGSVMPIPQQSMGFPDDPMAGITRAVHTSYSPEWRVETAPFQRVEGLPPGKRAMWRGGLVVEDDLAELAKHRAMQARAELSRTDYIITKSIDEGRAVSDAWKVWRASLRGIVNGSGEPIPDMPLPWGEGSSTSSVSLPASTISVRGTSYPLVSADALKLVGALALAVDGETASVTLASGDVLELTHQDVSDIGRQLAGKPADEVSG